MVEEKGVGTPSHDKVDHSTRLHDEAELPTQVTTNCTTHIKYPIRLSIRLKNRDKDGNPFAIFKGFLTELSHHDPTIKLGDHGEVFYSLSNFPNTNNDFEAAFHGKTRDGDHPSIKPFYTESVGNGASICTWCYLSSTLSMKQVHTKLRTWCIQKQVFIEPINIGYFGPHTRIHRISHRIEFKLHISLQSHPTN